MLPELPLPELVVEPEIPLDVLEPELDLSLVLEPALVLPLIPVADFEVPAVLLLSELPEVLLREPEALEEELDEISPDLLLLDELLVSDVLFSSLSDWFLSLVAIKISFNKKVDIISSHYSPVAQSFCGIGYFTSCYKQTFTQHSACPCCGVATGTVSIYLKLTAAGAVS